MKRTVISLARAIKKLVKTAFPTFPIEILIVWETQGEGWDQKANRDLQEKKLMECSKQVLQCSSKLLELFQLNNLGKIFQISKYSILA